MMTINKTSLLTSVFLPFLPIIAQILALKKENVSALIKTVYKVYYEVVNY